MRVGDREVDLFLILISTKERIQLCQYLQNSGITPLSGSDANPDSYIIIDVLSENKGEREREKERKRDRQADRQTDRQHFQSSKIDLQKM